MLPRTTAGPAALSADEILARLNESQREAVSHTGGSLLIQPGHGWDAQKAEYTDMFAAGIIDPAKVTRSALENAASVAALLLTTETIVTDLPEKDKAPMPGMGGGGMGDY